MNYQKSGNGWGALVMFENMQENVNSVVFTGCRFTGNDAAHGGGLAIISHLPPMVEAYTLSLVKIHKSTFSSNRAYHGLALYLHRISSNQGSSLGILLSNVGMYNNVPPDKYVTSTGVVYSYFSSLRLSGSLSFIGN